MFLIKFSCFNFLSIFFNSNHSKLRFTHRGDLDFKTFVEMVNFFCWFFIFWIIIKNNVFESIQMYLNKTLAFKFGALS